MVKTILVAIDLEHGAGHGEILRFARDLAESNGADVHLVSVVAAAPAIVSQFLHENYEQKASGQAERELASLAGPLLAILAAQTLATALFAAFVTFRLMGGDYDAAVISGGHCGFGMGATPTAVANMEAVTARYGPSPTAFIVIPLTGAFFIDLVNALVLGGYLALPLFGFP